MTTLSRRWSLIAALAVMPIAACSSGDTSNGDDAAPDPTTVPSTTASRTEPSTSITAADDDSVTVTSTTNAPPPDDGAATAGDDATDDDVAATTTVALIEGIEATIEPLTPVAGSGIRPLLEWSPVDGASHYMVVVYAPDGSPYWTWTGAATSVHVGGDPVLADDRPGPSVVDGMTWGIVALDDEIVPIASSDRRPIAP